MVFANLSAHEKDAFFSLLDELSDLHDRDPCGHNRTPYSKSPRH